MEWEETGGLGPLASLNLWLLRGELVGGRTGVKDYLLFLHPRQPVVLLQSTLAAILKMFGPVSLMSVSCANPCRKRIASRYCPIIRRGRGTRAGSLGRGGYRAEDLFSESVSLLSRF